MVLKNICVVGASGKLGPSLLPLLLDSPANFNVSVLQRASSKSTYDHRITIIQYADNASVSELTAALRGQDALVCIFAGSLKAEMLKLAEAAAAAKVQRVIPPDFGSCDSAEGSRALGLLPLFHGKKEVRDCLQRLSEENEGFSWTSIICGHFFDYGLESGLLHVWPDERRARIFDDGEKRWSTSTLGQIAKATVKVLEKDEETRDKLLYIQSFRVSQNQLLEACAKITSTKWKGKKVDSETYIQETMKTLEEAKAAGKKDEVTEHTESLVGVVGIVDADWEGKGAFANKLLGLDEEDLEDVVKSVLVGTSQRGWQFYGGGRDAEEDDNDADVCYFGSSPPHE